MGLKDTRVTNPSRIGSGTNSPSAVCTVWSAERWHPSGQAAFAVDHAKPKGKAKYAHLVCDYRNLLYVCNRCNSAKRDRILLDPCRAGFAQHLTVGPDGSIAANTKEGKRLIRILGLDLEGPTKVRWHYLCLAALYQWSPHDPEVRELYLYAFGFPDDLPNLASLRPTTNAKPAGIEASYLRQREAGRLPTTY